MYEFNFKLFGYMVDRTYICYLLAVARGQYSRSDFFYEGSILDIIRKKLYPNVHARGP